MSTPHQRDFIKDYAFDLPETATVDEIWARLNYYWNFLNYGLLEHVICAFNDEELQEKMQQFIDEFSVFKKETRLCEFVRNIEAKPSKTYQGRNL